MTKRGLLGKGKGLPIFGNVMHSLVEVKGVTLDRLSGRGDRREGANLPRAGREKALCLVAGPCSVESEEQAVNIACALAELGVSILRGGAFKGRTSTYSFQGLGEEGLRILALAGREANLPVVSEILDPRQIELFLPYVDIFQVGARSMGNEVLLSELGQIDRPVILKRGFTATLSEWLEAAEIVRKSGNPRVVLCERGIRTFADQARFTLDLNVIPALRAVSELPILVDPSHGTGRSDFVTPLAKAAVACGADGLMIEVHPQPEQALSDAEQSLSLAQFSALCREIQQLAELEGRSFPG